MYDTLWQLVHGNNNNNNNHNNSNNILIVLDLKPFCLCGYGEQHSLLVVCNIQYLHNSKAIMKLNEKLNGETANSNLYITSLSLKGSSMSLHIDN